METRKDEKQLIIQNIKVGIKILPFNHIYLELKQNNPENIESKEIVYITPETTGFLSTFLFSE